MPRGTGIPMSVSTTAQDYHALPIDVEVTGDEPGIVWNLTLQNLLDILNDPIRRLGAKLEIDWGTGSGLEEISLDDLVANLQTEESLANVSGGDSLTFRLFGRDYCPLVNDATRGKRKVRLTGITNADGSVERRVVFNGFFFGTKWQAYPPVSEIICLDVASNYNEILLNWNEDPGCTKTREEWLIEVLTYYDIPIGEISLGPFGKTKLTKGITIAETPIFEALQDALSPCGAFIGMEDGEFFAVAYTGNEVAVRTYKADDLAAGSLVAVPPDHSTPTKVATTSVTLTYTEPSGDRTEVSINQIVAPYAPKRATLKLNTSTGVETVMDDTSAAEEQPIERIITRRTYRGDMVIMTDVVRQKHYAPLAVSQQLAPAAGDPLLDSATVEALDGGPWAVSAVYQFADGTWHTVPEERFQTVSRTTHRKILDDENYVVEEREQKYFWHFTRKPVGRIAASGDVEFSGNAEIPIAETGEGVVYPYERIGGSKTSSSFYTPDEETITTYSRDDQGYLDSVDAETKYFDVGADQGSTRSGTYVYGFESRQFKKASVETFGLGKTIQSELYEVDPHRRGVHFLTRINTIIGAAAQGSGNYTETSGPDEIRSTRPRAERLEPQEVEQEFRGSSSDAVGIVWDGERIEYLHNEHCHNEGELENFSAHVLRLMRAHDVAFETVMDWLLHKRHWIRLEIPEVDIDHKLLIWSVTRNLQPGGFRQAVQALWFPPEVA